MNFAQIRKLLKQEREALRQRSGRVRRFPWQGLSVERLEDRLVLTTTVTNTIAGMSGGYFSGANGNFGTPPDTNMAVGPNEVVEVVNTSIEIADKSGNVLVAPQQFSQFFSSIFTAGDAFSDPYVLYDAVHQRFVVGIIEFPNPANPTTADLDFAVSNSANPGVDGWTVFHKITSVEESNTFPDFPKMGSNADGVYVSFNQFNNVGFTHDQILTIPWTSILSTSSGGALTGLVQTDIATGSDWNILIPAHMDDTATGSSAGGPEYFVASNIVAGGATTSSTITVYTETNTLSASPTFTPHTINVNPYSAVPGVAGLTNQIDSRMLSVDVTNGKLVAAGGVGLTADSLTHARWYELDVSGASPSLLQQGDITPGAGLDTSYPSIAIDPNGNMGMTFVQSGNPASPNWQTPSMYVTGRLASDPLNTMETPVLVTAGATSPISQSGHLRGGDYSMTLYDPSTNSFWSANEFTADSVSTDDWGTSMAQFRISANVAPSLMVTTPVVTNGTAYANTTSPSFSGTVADNSNTGIASVKLTIDGNAPVTATLGNNNTTWSYSATGLTDGNHTISVVATDNAAHTTTVNFTLKVDTVAPTLAVTTPTVTGGNGGSATVNTSNPSFAGTVGDASPSSGIASVTLSFDGGSAVAATLGNNNTTWSYAGTTLANGDHSVSVTATDNAGNSTSFSFTLHVIANPLVLTIPPGPLTYPAQSGGLNLAASATVTDGTTTFNGGQLAVSIIAGADPNDRLTLVNQGFGPGKVSVFANRIYYGLTQIGTIDPVQNGSNQYPLVVYFTSSAVNANIAQAVVRDIQFSNSSASPSNSQRNIQFVLVDSQYNSSGGVDVALNVAVPHVAPSITLNTGGITYAVQAPAALLAPTATLTLGSATSFPGGTLTVSFTNNGTASDGLTILSQGQISVTGSNVYYSGNLIGAFTGGTGGSALVIALTAQAGKTATQALIDAIAFQNGSATPSTAPRTVQFQLNDGAGGVSTAVTETVQISAPPPNPSGHVINIGPGGFLGYSLGSPPLLLLGKAAIFSDSATSNFAGSTLQVASNHGGDVLGILPNATIQLAGNTIRYFNGVNTVVIGTLSGNTVTFSAAATQQAIQALLATYAFSGPGYAFAPFGPRMITFTFTDSLHNMGSTSVYVNVNGISI